MVSGKPPRRSKTTEEPVIIDLQATEVAPDKPADEAAPSVTPAPETVTDTPPPEPTLHPETAPTSEASATSPEQPPKEEATAETAPEKEADTTSTSMFGSETADPDNQPSNEEVAAPQRRSSSSTSGLLAAGIAGGLIALIGAGALQYAGVVPGVGSNGNADTLAALSAEVESLKNAPAKADTSALEARLAKLESSQQQGQTTGVDSAAVSDLQAKIAGTNQAVDQLKSDVTGRIQTLTSGQSNLSDTLAAIQAKLNKPRDDIEVARAIAASALKTAADRGGPFLSELRTLGSIVPEDPAIAALEPYAATGAVSRAELLQRFQTVANTILSAINQPAESANIGERLMASALSVIKVRPVGNVAGDSPSAIVARIEDKIRNGDLKGAAAEWETLPEAGRAVSANFKKALDARIAVEAQVSDALARSVAGRQG